MRKLTGILLTACLLPLHAGAEENVIYPPYQGDYFYECGMAVIHFDQQFTGCTINLIRSQEEGTFLHYTYEPSLFEEGELHCPLMAGDYLLELIMPSDTGTGIVSYQLPFVIYDPEDDASQSFTYMQADITLSHDPKAEKDTLHSEEPVLTDSTVYASHSLTVARRDFMVGDMQSDGMIDTSDASEILIAIAEMGAGTDSRLTAMQLKEADVNGDGILSTSDASLILVYIAEAGVDPTVGTLTDYLITLSE